MLDVSTMKFKVDLIAKNNENLVSLYKNEKFCTWLRIKLNV